MKYKGLIKKDFIKKKCENVNNNKKNSKSMKEKNKEN